MIILFNNEYDSNPQYLLTLARLVKFKLRRENKADPTYWKVSKNRKLRMKGQHYLGYRTVAKYFMTYREAQEK